MTTQQIDKDNSVLLGDLDWVKNNEKVCKELEDKMNALIREYLPRLQGKNTELLVYNKVPVNEYVRSNIFKREDIGERSVWVSFSSDL